jgi:formate hydrogenlyase subunit 6/NADH:ubiquinone oxidoreductase subunit I
MAVCPSQCIYIETAEDEEGRRYPLTYELDASRCIFCGFCEEACPVKAIFMGKNYEWVEGDRKVYLMTTEKLLEEKKVNP